jgi:putative hydrolase of the HAD superfamily
MEELGLKDIFDSAFFSADLGVTKSDPEFFRKIAEKLEVSVTELNYWDDDQKNVDVASALGVAAQLYTTPEKFRQTLLN